MTISERVAYIKGLADGMKIDQNTNEGKIAFALLDLLKDVAREIEIIENELDEMEETVSTIEENLYDLEDEVYGEIDLDDYDDDDDDLYEITCRNCDNTLSVDMSMLEGGKVTCPNCGEVIEFDIDIIDSDECDPGHDT